MTDKDLALLLADDVPHTDAIFRMRVIEQICIRSGRVNAVRRLLVVFGAFLLIGAVFAVPGWIGLTPEAVEIAASALFLAGLSYELAVWAIVGRSVLAEQVERLNR